MLKKLKKPNKLTFAIIGTGFIFRNHVQAIYKIGGEIVDVIDESHGEDAWKEMAKSTEADCIVILAPNNLHFEMTKFSSENGKIVLCEKPLTINSKEAKILTKYPNIFTVCQLRYHPLVKQLKSEIYSHGPIRISERSPEGGARLGYSHAKNYKIEMDISVHRDESYWKSWKGQKERTGGILFNLGIHYFDLLLYLFGKPTKVLTYSLGEKAGEGIIEGENYKCHWRVSGEEPKETQQRVFKINGTPYNFYSNENLHICVYKDLLEGRGVTPKDALSSIELIEKIYASAKK